MSTPQPRLAQRTLEAVAAGCDNLAALIQATGLDRKPLNNTVQRLRRRGYIEIQEPGHYRLTPAGAEWISGGRCISAGQGRRVRLASGLRERAWWLMRERRAFTVGDLLTTLADGSERDAAANLRRYIRVLEAVGVLVRLHRRAGGTDVIWRLIRDLGRRPPVWRARTREVFDPNAGAVVTTEEAAHD